MCGGGSGSLECRLSVQGLREVGVQGLERLGYRGAVQGMEMRIEVQSPRGELWALSCGLGGAGQRNGRLRGMLKVVCGQTARLDPGAHDRWEGNGPWASMAGGRWYQHPNIPSAPPAPLSQHMLHPIHPPCTPQTGAAPSPAPTALSPPQDPLSALGTPMHPQAYSPPPWGPCVSHCGQEQPPQPPPVSL